jgi:hypothetical protein
LVESGTLSEQFIPLSAANRPAISDLRTIQISWLVLDLVDKGKHVFQRDILGDVVCG